MSQLPAACWRNVSIGKRRKLPQALPSVEKIIAKSETLEVQGINSGITEEQDFVLFPADLFHQLVISSLLLSPDQVVGVRERGELFCKTRRNAPTVAKLTWAIITIENGILLHSSEIDVYEK